MLRDAEELPDALTVLPAWLEARSDLRPVLFLDYDGTLAPVVSDPGDAVVPDAVRTRLDALVDRMDTWIVTGRDAADIRRFLPKLDVGVIGNHGLERSMPDGTVRRAAGLQPELAALTTVADDLEAALADITGAHLERKRFAVVAHDRNVPEALRPRVAEAARAAHARHPSLRLVEGRRIHEFRPGVAVDKGTAVLEVLDALEAPCFAVYLGDDTTDEDAFRALRTTGRGIGIKVQDPESAPRTAADAVLSSQRQVPLALQILVDAYDV